MLNVTKPKHTRRMAAYLGANDSFPAFVAEHIKEKEIFENTIDLFAAARKNQTLTNTWQY